MPTDLNNAAYLVLLLIFSPYIFAGQGDVQERIHHDDDTFSRLSIHEYGVEATLAPHQHAEFFIFPPVFLNTTFTSLINTTILHCNVTTARNITIHLNLFHAEFRNATLMRKWISTIPLQNFTHTDMLFGMFANFSLGDYANEMIPFTLTQYSHFSGFCIDIYNPSTFYNAWVNISYRMLDKIYYRIENWTYSEDYGNVSEWTTITTSTTTITSNSSSSNSSYTEPLSEIMAFNMGVSCFLIGSCIVTFVILGNTILLRRRLQKNEI